MADEQDSVSFTDDFNRSDVGPQWQQTPASEVPTGDRLPREIPAGEWVDVTKSNGMIPALGVVPDPDYPGVLRTVDNTGEVYGGAVVWHNKGCTRTGILPQHVRFDIKGAPWCPTCFAENIQRDPSWNSPTEAHVTETPAPQNLSDIGRQRRIEKIRKAVQEGTFRDPSLASAPTTPGPQSDLPTEQVRDSVSGLGNPNRIPGEPHRQSEPPGSGIRPPEQFD